MSSSEKKKSGFDSLSFSEVVPLTEEPKKDTPSPVEFTTVKPQEGYWIFHKAIADVTPEEFIEWMELIVPSSDPSDQFDVKQFQTQSQREKAVSKVVRLFATELPMLSHRSPKKNEYKN